jgi:hypothetical protein
MMVFCLLRDFNEKGIRPDYYDEKQYHEEEDSMAEYGNGEGGKFNEDGSFIGLYGRDRVQTYIVQYDKDDPNNPNDSSKPYSTFV